MHWASPALILLAIVACPSYQNLTEKQDQPPQQPELYQEQPAASVDVASYPQEQQQISPNSIDTPAVLYPEINMAEDMPIPLPEVPPVPIPYPQNNYQQQNYPQQTYPQQTYPQQTYPQQTLPQQNYPQQNYPQQNYPQQNYPQQNYPQQNYPQSSQGSQQPGTYPTGIQGSYPQPQQTYQAQASSGYAPGYDPVSLSQNAYDTVKNYNQYLMNNNPPPNAVHRPIPYNSGPIAWPPGVVPFFGGPGTGLGVGMMDPQSMDDDDDDDDDREHEHGSGGGLLARIRGMLGGGSSGGDGGGGGGGIGGALGTVTGLIGGLLPGGGMSSLNDEGSILPIGTKLTFNNDLSIPMPPPLEQIKITIPFAYNYNGNRDGFKPLQSSRKRRSLQDDQFNIFKTVEKALANIGVDGKSCVLRAICEVNEKPLRGINLIGEIATIILSPKPRVDGSDFLDEYLVARKVGRSKTGCWKKYAKCPFSIAGFVQGLELEHNTTT